MIKGHKIYRYLFIAVFLLYLSCVVLSLCCWPKFCSEQLRSREEELRNISDRNLLGEFIAAPLFVIYWLFLCGLNMLHSIFATCTIRMTNEDIFQLLLYEEDEKNKKKMKFHFFLSRRHSTS